MPTPPNQSYLFHFFQFNLYSGYELYNDWFSHFSKYIYDVCHSGFMSTSP